MYPVVHVQMGRARTRNRKVGIRWDGLVGRTRAEVERIQEFVCLHEHEEEREEECDHKHEQERQRECEEQHEEQRERWRNC